ncbi:MAG: glycosyltransferase family 4 protein [Bacteroidota bacterium]
MKILQLANKIPYPPRDGGAIATLNISLGLAELGHEVTVLGMNTPKHFTDISALPPKIKNTIRIFDVEVDTDINLWYAFTNLLFSKLPYNATRFFSRKFEKQLIGLLKKEHFDIIQLEGLYLCFYIDTIRKYSKALISLRAHNIEYEIWERSANFEKNYFKRKYFYLLARRIRRFELNYLNKYDLLLPITSRDARKYNRMGNQLPSQTIPVGYDLDNLSLKKGNVKFPSLFFIGTLDWFPNQEGLIWFLENVWIELLEMNPGLSFHIAGRNAPLKMKKLFRKYRNVVFHGEVEDGELFIRENAIMIAPLFSGSGMRVKIIEGMAMGKTIVTTSIGAEGIDVVHEHNIIIEDLSFDFIAQINALVRDKKRFERIGRNAAIFIQSHYNNKTISKTLAEFYARKVQLICK